MVDAIIVLIVIVLLIFALKGTLKHFKGESPCCGGGSGLIKTEIEEKKEYLKRNSKRTKIKIIDDVDDSEIDRIKKEGIDSEVQIIVFARRSCWIDECIAPLDNYYYINGGKMIKMINGIEKEIKTVYQLKKLFLKGIYDI